MMEQKVLKTQCQQEREQRDMNILNDYNELMSIGGQSKTRVNELLMDKYHVHSVTAIYIMRRRAEERLREEARND